MYILNLPLLRKLKTKYSYDNIPLKLFVEIINTQNIKLLGGLNYRRAWEEIIKENSKATNNHSYEVFTSTFLRHNKLAMEYVIVKASLLQLSFKPDKKIIEDLVRRGYKIDVSSSENYLHSINKCLSKCTNLINKMGIAKSQLKAFVTQIGEVERKTFDALIAELNTRLGFVVDEAITLSRYNEYNKVLEKKAEQQRKASHARNK